MKGGDIKRGGQQGRVRGRIEGGHIKGDTSRTCVRDGHIKGGDALRGHIMEADATHEGGPHQGREGELGSIKRGNGSRGHCGDTTMNGWNAHQGEHTQGDVSRVKGERIKADIKHEGRGHIKGTQQGDASKGEAPGDASRGGGACNCICC